MSKKLRKEELHFKYQIRFTKQTPNGNLVAFLKAWRPVSHDIMSSMFEMFNWLLG